MNLRQMSFFGRRALRDDGQGRQELGCRTGRQQCHQAPGRPDRIFPLFERINNRLFPTAEARSLYQDSDPIFMMHAALEASAGFEGEQGRPSPALATPPLGYSVTPSALRRFLRDGPKMRVFFDVRRFENVIDSVDNGLAELGFVMGLGDYRGSTPRSFFSERMGLRDAPDHPSRKRATIVPGDLKNVPSSRSITGPRWAR